MLSLSRDSHRSLLSSHSSFRLCTGTLWRVPAVRDGDSVLPLPLNNLFVRLAVVHIHRGVGLDRELGQAEHV